MNMLSKYMSYEEGVRSDTAERLGIDNTPNAEQLKNMQFVASEIADKVREFVGGPISCSSFFRCLELNRRLGSSDRSFHPLGAAIDLKKIGNSKSYAEIFDFIRCNLDFSELIWEYGDENEPAWVHVAYLKGDNRKMVKRAFRDEKGKSRIKPFDLY